MTEQAGFETRAIHAGQEPDPSSGAVVPPIHLSTTFRQRAVGSHQGFEYSRSGNPTRAALEHQLAALEGASHAYAFASGLAAEDAVLRALLQPGDRVLLANDVYGGTYRLISQVYRPLGVQFSTADLTDPSAVAGTLSSPTRLVWVETPSNPRLGVTDLANLSGAVHRAGARLVVDNTFATPFLQNPLALGADLVLHSSTKYLGGHSDVVGGIVALNDPALAEKLGFLQNASGAVPAPFDCYLVQRGIKTLAVRMERHCRTAQRVAEFLSGQPAVAQVLYPGLPDHPGHAVARRQMRGFGGMVSFLHRDGETAAREFAARTRLFTLAESLGAVESLVEHPAAMTHAAAAGSPLEVDPALVRLSVGLESEADLIADLRSALTD